MHGRTKCATIEVECSRAVPDDEAGCDCGGTLGTERERAHSPDPKIRWSPLMNFMELGYDIPAAPTDSWRTFDEVNPDPEYFEFDWLPAREEPRPPVTNTVKDSVSQRL